MRSASYLALSGSVSTDLVSATIPASAIVQASVAISVSGATDPSGTVYLQAANEQPGGLIGNGFQPSAWVNIPGASATVTGNGTYLVSATTTAYEWLRVVYIRAGGSGGTLTATYQGVGPSVGQAIIYSSGGSGGGGGGGGTPDAHAATHQLGGSDVLELDQSQVNGLTTALAAKANTSSLAAVATAGTYASLTGKPTLANVATSGAYSDLSGKPTLAAVATSGAYSDLSGKPALGTAAALNAGTASGVATLDASGKIPSTQVPAIAVNNTFVVASQAAMTALAADKGDVAVRTDLSKSFILAATPASTLANWQELLSPTSPVLSVHGRVGAVTGNSGDYTASQISGLGTAATKNVGTTAGTVAAGDDLRFTDSRTPAAHAASHGVGQADAITVAQSQVTGLDTALAAKANTASLATVATTGSYADLSNKPTGLPTSTLMGKSLSATGPTVNGQLPIYNSTSGVWEVTSATAPAAGQASYFYHDGTTPRWRTLGLDGDVNASTSTNLKVQKIQGTPVVTTTPAAGQMLTYDSTATGTLGNGSAFTGAWKPTALAIGTKAVDTTAIVAGDDGKVLTYDNTASKWVAKTPAVSAGSVTLTGDVTGPASSNTIATNAVTTAKILDGAVTSAKLANGVIPTALPPNGTAAGTGSDLAGNYPSPTIAKLQGKTLTIGATPATNDVLSWNGTAFVNAPANVSAGSVTLAGDVTGAASSNSIGAGKVGTTALADSAVATAKIATGAVTADKIATGVIPTVPTSLNVGGDLSGTTASATVTRVQNKLVSLTSPATGDVLSYDSTLGSGAGGFKNAPVVLPLPTRINALESGIQVAIDPTSASFTLGSTAPYYHIGAQAITAFTPAAGTVAGTGTQGTLPFASPGKVTSGGLLFGADKDSSGNVVRQNLLITAINNTPGAISDNGFASYMWFKFDDGLTAQKSTPRSWANRRLLFGVNGNNDYLKFWDGSSGTIPAIVVSAGQHSSAPYVSLWIDHSTGSKELTSAPLVEKDSAWHLLGLSYSSGTLDVYLDGFQIDSFSASVTGLTNKINHFVFGCHDGPQSITATWGQATYTLGQFRWIGQGAANHRTTYDATFYKNMFAKGNGYGSTWAAGMYANSQNYPY